MIDVLSEDGYIVAKSVLEKSYIEDVIQEVENSELDIPKYGIRNAETKLSTIAQIVENSEIVAIARTILGGNVKKVRVIFFDKTPEKNWLVTWHQDRTIAVDSKGDCEGYGPWTIKDGTHHVQPPLEVLEQMIAFRIHLDDTDESNGCLKVIPGSHKMGLMTQEEINQYTKDKKSQICICKAGDAVIMRPHILHSSSKSENPDHRRIVHIEYSSYKLPDGLNWV